MKKTKRKKRKKTKIWDWKVNVLIGLSLIAIVFAFLAPLLFTGFFSSMEFNSETSSIGNTFGGLATPFIAIAGICITFLAFYMQLRANQIQVRNFQEEISIQKRQNNLNQFEGKFYEMIRLHKENVHEIKLLIPERNSDGTLEYTEISGREAFQYLENELELVYRFILRKKLYKEREFRMAYQAFFSGIFNKPAFEELKSLVENHESRFVGPWPGRRPTQFLEDTAVIAKYKILQGHENKLGHYYRHLFQTVKYVTDQKESFLSYKKKRGYLGLLRAQLSNYEQLMIFYNYFGSASEWEEENKFLTDFRMIHNLNRSLIFDSNEDDEGELLKEFDSLVKKEETSKRCKDPDPIFDMIYV